MSTFIFKRADWLAHAASLLKRKQPEVGVTSKRFAEFKRLAAEPPSDDPKEREEYEALRATWLASREAGC